MNNKIINIVISFMFLIAVTLTVTLGLTGAAKAEKTTAEPKVKDEYIVAVDAGHGGFDPGKVGVNGELEKEINLIICNKLKTSLENKDVKVVLTREDDNGLYDENATNKKASDMKKRCELIEKENVDFVISIHQNSYTDASVKGAQTFYYSHSEKGKKLASTVMESIRENVCPENKRQIKANDNYYMLVHTKCPIIIVECGFLSNYEEVKLLVDDDYQNKLAEAIAQGAVDFISLNE